MSGMLLSEYFVLRDTVRQTSRGKSAAADSPYRVTTMYSFYPVLRNICWNNNSDALKRQIMRFHEWLFTSARIATPAEPTAR